MTRGDRDTKKRAQQIKAEQGMKYTEALRLAQQDEAPTNGESYVNMIDSIHRHLAKSVKPDIRWIKPSPGSKALWLHYDHPTQGALDICTLIMRGNSIIVRPSLPMFRTSPLYRAGGDLPLLDRLDNEASRHLPDGGTSRVVGNEVRIDLTYFVDPGDLQNVAEVLCESLVSRAEHMPAGRISGSTLDTGVTGNKVLGYMRSGMKDPLDTNGWTRFLTVSPSPYLLAMDGTDKTEEEKFHTVDQALGDRISESEQRGWEPWEGIPLVVILDCTSGDEYLDNETVKRVLRNPDNGVFIHAITSKTAGELRHPTTAMLPA